MPQKSKDPQGRLLFGQVLTCYNDMPQLVPGKDEFPKNMFLLAGKVYLFAWYTAMARAMLQEDVDRITRLHEMALTLSVRAILSADDASMILGSMQASEQLRAAEQADSFVQFAKKLDRLMDEAERVAGVKKTSTGQSKDDSEGTPMLQHLKNLDVAFNGGKLNKTMLNAALNLISTMPLEAEQAFGALDREFGMETWTKGYNKVMRLCHICQKQGQLLGRAPGELMTFVLQTSLMSLRRPLLDAGFFTLANLDNKGAERPGWMAATCVKAALLKHIQDIVETASNLASKEVPALQKDLEVLRKLCNPSTFNETLPKQGGEDEDEEGADSQMTLTLGDIVEEAGADKMTALVEPCSKAGRLFAEIVRDLWEGVYEKALKALVPERVPFEAALDPEKSGQTNFFKALKAASSVPRSVARSF